MKVLLISHTCQSRTEGQPRPQAIGQIPDVDLMLLTPDRWKHYGQWRRAQKPLDASFRYTIGRVAWPWVGPAQNYAHWYPSLAGVLRRFQPDIIDIWEENWGLVSAQTCWLRDQIVPAAKIVAETEQNILKALPPPFESIRKYVLQHTDFVVCRNSEAVEVVRAKGFNGPFRVVPNAVDAQLFRPLDRAQCRRQWNLSGFTVGYIGRIIEDKGLMDLLEALPLCPPDVRLLLIGNGDYRAVLEGRARELNLESRVRFESARPLEELPVAMNAIDVLALPSRTTPSWKEQFGRVLIEAHACATPVIGSDSGAIPDVVGEAGLIVPERNPHALAQSISLLANDPARGRIMGEMGRRQVEARYTWTRVGEQMHEVYRSLLDDRP